jgi:hypothetical protein
MSTASNPGQRSGSSMAQSAPSLNPFPATAVAPLAMPSSDFWSIETEALKQARTQLRDYLKRTGQEQRQPSRRNAKGIILAIIGDYGTGKTHIAQDML